LAVGSSASPPIFNLATITAAVSTDSIFIITLLPVNGLNLPVAAKLRSQTFFRRRISEIVAFNVGWTDPVAFHLAQTIAAVAFLEVSVVALLEVVRVVLAISAFGELDLRGADGGLTGNGEAAPRFLDEAGLAS
jgi:hypothetical protein